MTQPQVNITVTDGALGVLPPSAGRLFALVGPADAGPIATPATFARTKDILATFSAGPMVEAAAHAIERYGKPVVLVRTTATVAGDHGTIDVTGVTGTSVVTFAATEPNDDYELYFLVKHGGTIGVAGITFQWSLDGGRTLSPLTALGTASTYAIPGTGGVTLDFAAGTLVAGDVVKSRMVAPNWNTSDLGVALDALGISSVAWELVEIVGPMDGNAIDEADLKISGLAVANGKWRAWIGNSRMPTVGESESAYLTAMSTLTGSHTSKFGVLCLGAEKLTSSVNGRKYKRPVAFSYAAREASVSEEVDTADVNLGALPGVSIRDANGNTDEHDESANPGLDDLRCTVLRTWDGFQGVYVNRPRLFSPDGSDFQLLPHRRVFNLAAEALLRFFVLRLNKDVQVDKNTGFILEQEALEIEAGAKATMRAVLLAKPKASAIDFVLSRTDNLLTTKLMNGTARIVPLAYPEFINIDLGFLNPALQVKPV